MNTSIFSSLSAFAISSTILFVSSFGNTITLSVVDPEVPVSVISLSGSDGLSGVIGFSGSTGVTGLSGVSGFSGSSGVSGSSG